MIGTTELDARPESYFRPEMLERYLLSKLKGSVLRRELQGLLDAGRDAELDHLLSAGGPSTEERLALESHHPMFMGGNYLPDMNAGEVEIARISLSSTTYDVVCVYGRREEGSIRLRVVDEYEGETLQGITEVTIERPLTLGEFAQFFLEAWPLMTVLERNFEGDQHASLDFFFAESEFYPDFDALCRQLVIERFPEPEYECDAGD